MGAVLNNIVRCSVSVESCNRVVILYSSLFVYSMQMIECITKRLTALTGHYFNLYM